MAHQHGPIHGVSTSGVEDQSKILKVEASDGKTGLRTTLSYTNSQYLGNGSFGVVFFAKLVNADGTEGDEIAVKKVLQDTRFQASLMNSLGSSRQNLTTNRELKIMRKISHPNVIDLKAFFYSSGEKEGEIYLNLVLEYVPETLYRASRYYVKINQHMPMIQIKLYVYQLFRSIGYIHSIGLCHRDIKPQNLLIHPQTAVLKLIDFGSSKMLVTGEPNVSYICSRYYRAPEAIFGSTSYNNMIDIWSIGCVMAELMLGQPLFQGDSGINQLVEIIKVLGTPSRDQIKTMNPNYMEHKFPQIKSQPLNKVFRPRTAPDALDLLSHLLQYDPGKRLTAYEALSHPFFDELRIEGEVLPSGKPYPPLFDFSKEELSAFPSLISQLVPSWSEPELASRGIRLEEFVPTPVQDLRISLD